MSGFPARRHELSVIDIHNWLVELTERSKHDAVVFAELKRELREVQESLVRLEQRHGVLDATAVRLEAEIARIGQETAVLADEYDELDGRFTQVLANRTPQAIGASPRHVEHQEIAERFRTFVDQELTSAARAAAWPKRRRGRGGATDTELLAERLAELCEAMFAGPGVDEERLRTVLADAPDWLVRLATTGGELRWRARAAAPEGAWSFSAHPGQPINPGYQRAWGDCDPATPVARVIVPAYLVGDRVFEPQRVTTHNP